MLRLRVSIRESLKVSSVCLAVLNKIIEKDKSFKMPLNRSQKIGIIGCCMFLFSILFQTAIFPAVVKSQVRRKIALKRGWVMRDIWSKFPFVIEFQFYIFNITNPEEIAKGEKPTVQEIGPFVYDEWQEKTNQIDHEEDDTVSFTFKYTYYFNAEKSNGLTGDEEVVVPSYFALALINSIKREKPSAMPIVGKAIDSIFKKPSSLFIKAKVRDILFDGLIIDCTVTDFAGSAVCAEINANYKEFRLKKAKENVYTMSLWGPLNGTDAKGRTRVYRGLKNFMDVGTVVEYNGKKNISVWNDDYCDQFNGTDGTIFHPFFDKKGKDDLVVFNQNLCRSVSCHYDSQKVKFAGMKLLRYTADLGLDPENNPRHKCFCDPKDQCLRKGAYDLTKCVLAPLILTNPHYYLADPYYLSQVDGLNPNKDKHMLIVDLDAFTGAPVHTHTRAQFNMFITKVEKFKLMKNFPDALLPLFWFDEIIILPDFLLKDIKDAQKLIILAHVYKYLMMFGGLGLAGYAGFLHYKSNFVKNNLNDNKTVAKSKDNSSSSNDKKLPQMNISTVQVPQGPPNVD